MHRDEHGDNKVNNDMGISITRRTDIYICHERATKRTATQRTKGTEEGKANVHESPEVDQRYASFRSQ